ncbi:hypothetical protein BDQ94DRAFT_152517, partial [Aspergillus welwitschiae]
MAWDHASVGIPYAYNASSTPISDCYSLSISCHDAINLFCTHGSCSQNPPGGVAATDCYIWKCRETTVRKFEDATQVMHWNGPV